MSKSSEKEEHLLGYISKADASEITVTAMTKSAERMLKNKGFFVYMDDEKRWKISVNDEKGKADIFRFLRDQDFCFSSGREWSPSEVFEYLKEKGLLTGKYKRISWIAPGKYRIQTTG